MGPFDLTQLTSAMARGDIDARTLREGEAEVQFKAGWINIIQAVFLHISALSKPIKRKKNPDCYRCSFHLTHAYGIIQSSTDVSSNRYSSWNCEFSLQSRRAVCEASAVWALILISFIWGFILSQRKLPCAAASIRANTETVKFSHRLTFQSHNSIIPSCLFTFQMRKEQGFASGMPRRGKSKHGKSE